LNRAAIENANGVALWTQPLDQTLADMVMHGGDVVAGRGLAGADRPDRLIGDGRIGAIGFQRHAAFDLAMTNRRRMTAVALILTLADADDDIEPRAPGGFGLGRHHRIGFAMELATLGMADKDVSGARVLEH